MPEDAKQPQASQGEEKDRNVPSPTAAESDGVVITAVSAPSSTNRSFFKTLVQTLEKPFALLANVVVVLGIIFALVQYIQSNRAEKRRLAIEAVSQTRSNDFLKAYSNLKAAYRDGRIEGEPTSIKDDINYVMNVYDHIALLYINDLADRCIIRNSIHPAVKDLLPICDAMSYPKKYREHLDTLLNLMEQERCG